MASEIGRNVWCPGITVKRYLGVFRNKDEVDGSRKTEAEMAIGFNNMKFTDNLAKGSLSERDSEP